MSKPSILQGEIEDYLREQGWRQDARPFSQIFNWTRESWGEWWERTDKPVFDRDRFEERRRYLDFEGAVREQIMYEKGEWENGWPW